MSNIAEQVRDKVRELGYADVDDLAPLMAPLSREQIARALRRCVYLKWLEFDGNRRVSGQGLRTSLPGIYRPVGGPIPPTRPRPRVVPLTSVWDLAQDRRIAPWPPAFHGGRPYQLLWDEA